MNAVGRARHQHGVRLGSVLGGIDDREKPHAIPHGNLVVLLGVMSAECIARVFGDIGSQADGREHEQGDAQRTAPARWRRKGRKVRRHGVRLQDLCGRATFTSFGLRQEPPKRNGRISKSKILLEPGGTPVIFPVLVDSCAVMTNIIPRGTCALWMLPLSNSRRACNDGPTQ